MKVSKYLAMSSVNLIEPPSSAKFLINYISLGLLSVISSRVDPPPLAPLAGAALPPLPLSLPVSS